ncbi:MAG: alpha/beta fold hydrolase [Anaerolineales bacterium]
MFAPPPNTHPTIAKLFETFFTPQKLETSVASLAFLNTALASRIPFKDITLAVSTWGEGPTILLVHGWGGNRSQLRGFVPPLVEAGFRVVAFDFPAHGDTSDGVTNILEMTDALQKVEDIEGPFHAIIAHSFGTLATSYLLSRHPERTPSRLVYFGAMNRLMDALPRFQAMAGLPDTLIAQLRISIEEVFGRELLNAIHNASLVQTIHIPTLMFHDELDPITPVEDSQAIALAWPSAELTITKGLGHRNALRDEKIIRKVVDFVAQGVGEWSPARV